MIKQDLRKGILSNFIAKYSNTFLQLIITSILARLLSPKEFGIVAVVSVFITFFNLLGDMGIGPAIIQNKNLTKKDTINIFNFTVLIGLLSAGLFCLSGRFVAEFYNNNDYINIIAMLSLVVFFSILNIVPQNLLYKEKKFLSVGLINVSANLISGCIAIILAFMGWSYFALIIQSILSALIRLILSVKFVGLKMKIQWGFYSVRKILSFSTYQFSFNFVNYFSRNMDNLLISKVIGVEALGYYDKAYKLMLYPLQSITFVITPVLHPVLSEHQDDTNFIYKTYGKIINILSLIGGFFSIYCFFAAKEIILIIFGENWLGSVLAFKILAISLIFQMVSSSSGSIFQATNNVKYLFISGILSAIVNITSIVIGTVYGKIEYVALGIVIAFGINFFQVCYLLSRYVFRKPTFSLLKEMRHTCIVCIIMILFLSLINIDLNIAILSALFKLVIAVVSFILGLFVTRQLKTVKDVLMRK
ncbi:lipopolysaccharide biosynthesis protein [Priestia megaterium]